MVEELICEETGETTAMRLLTDDPPVVEVSFRARGRLLDHAEVNLGSYTAEVRSDQTLTGDGHGVIITEDGDFVTWHGTGLGTLNGPGQGFSWNIAVHYKTSAPRLARLNNVIGLLEYITVDGVKSEMKTYQWKPPGLA
jgi:hypothetical protein